MESTPDIPAMIERLSGPPGDPSCHGMAGEVARLGGQAVPYLLGALDHPHPQVRRRTVKALGVVREHFAFCQDWLVEGDVPPDRRAGLEAYIQSVEPHLPAIVQGLLLVHRFDQDGAIRWWTERALGYGKLERIPLVCYREYLERVRSFQRWDYCSAMADGLLSKNADYELIARDAWRGSASGLKAQCLQDMLPEEEARDREHVAERLGSLGLRPAQVALLLAADMEQLGEVSARIVRELEGLPAGAKLEDVPYTIIQAVPGSGGPGRRPRPFARWSRRRGLVGVAVAFLALEGSAAWLFRLGLDWTGDALKDETSPRVLLGAGACMLALFVAFFALGAGLLYGWEILFHPDPSPRTDGPRTLIVPLLRERLGTVEIRELPPG